MGAETRYALSGDVHIAYQVTGEGPFDLVFVPGFVTHMELQWKMPGFDDFLNDLGSFARLIRFDKRGTGMSDPVSGAPSLETRMDDVRAVMDAAGSRRAAFYGLSEGAAMSILFAATYPERVAALVVRSCSPRTMWAPDFPWGRSEEAYQREMNQALRVYADRDEARKVVRSLGMQSEDAGRGIYRPAPLRSKSRDARGALPNEQRDRHSRCSADGACTGARACTAARIRSCLWRSADTRRNGFGRRALSNFRGSATSRSEAP